MMENEEARLREWRKEWEERKMEDEARKKQLEETWRKEWEDKMISEEEERRRMR